MRHAALLLVLLSTGCVVDGGVAPPGGGGGGGGGEVASLVQAVGEPMSGFPSPEERLGIMAINRARSDPSTVKGAQSTVFPARPPILWSYDLSRSSRFHAVNMQSSKASLMHDSPCPLNANVANNGCDGQVACACVGGAVGMACRNCANVQPVGNGCGTATFTRIGMFSAIATGEVAAAGYQDTWATVLGWVNEAAGADGHRKNLLDQGITSNTMGFGHAGGGGCWSSFDVSDSGRQNGLVIPAIPSAAVSPARPAGGNARFWASWADAGGAPRSLWVVVDGACTALKQELGTPTLNSTWFADLNLSNACHTWYVLGIAAGGARTTFPTAGAYTSGNGCAGDYVAQQPGAACEGMVPGPDLAMGGGKVDLAMGGGKVDLATGGGARDLAGVPAVDLSLILGDGDLVGPRGGGTTGCAVVGGMARADASCPAGALLSLPALLGLVALRRRRPSA